MPPQKYVHAQLHELNLPNPPPIAVAGHIKTPAFLPAACELPVNLGVRQVVALIGVQRQAQLALNLAQVVAHVVRVLGQVNRLQRQPTQPLTAIHRLQCDTWHAHGWNLLPKARPQCAAWHMAACMQRHTSCWAFATPPEPGFAPCSRAEMKLMATYCGSCHRQLRLLLRDLQSVLQRDARRGRRHAPKAV
jgi:hypothetical protein